MKETFPCTASILQDSITPSSVTVTATTETSVVVVPSSSPALSAPMVAETAKPVFTAPASLATSPPTVFSPAFFTKFTKSPTAIDTLAARSASAGAVVSVKAILVASSTVLPVTYSQNANVCSSHSLPTPE